MIINIDECNRPWVVTANFERSIRYSERSAMFKWMAMEFGRGSFHIEDEMGGTIIIRFQNESDAILFKIKYHGTV